MRLENTKRDLSAEQKVRFAAMLSEGRKTVEIAKELGITTRTVNYWKKSIANEPEPETNDTGGAEGTGAVTVEAVQAASESPAAERPPVCEPQKALSEDETRADEQPARPSRPAAVAAEASTGGQPQPTAETCSVIEREALSDVPSVPSVPMKPNPLYIETKSRHVQLLMQPSLHDKVKKLAAQKGLSLNEFVHKALEAL